MDFKNLNSQVLTLIDLNQQLDTLNYSDPEYDKMEDKIHELQDSLNEDYGVYFDKVLIKAYKQVNCGDDVLNFTDYIARNYSKANENTQGTQYTVDPDDCIAVTLSHDSAKGQSFEGTLYFQPNPLRLVLSLGAHERILWNSAEVK